MPDTAQARLLLAILQRRWSEATALARAAGAPAPAAFVACCRQADVLTWVHALLESEDRSDLIGDEAMATLATIRAKVQRDNLLLFARAEQAFDALLAAGVVPIVLKGLDVLQRLYGRFDERMLDDVDLLIESSQLPDALEALRKAGWLLPPEASATHYVRSSHHLPLTSPGAVPVMFELHWNLAQEERFRVDGEGIFRRAVPSVIAGREVFRMEDHDLVAHLLLHHFTHYFDRRLKWAVDMQLIAAEPGFRWETVAERVRRWGATAAAGMSLVHLARTVPAMIPDEILAALPVALWRRLAVAPLRSAHPLDLFRGTRRRAVQLYLAAALLERPSLLPRWLIHRVLRERRAGDNPLDHNASRQDEAAPRHEGKR